MSDIKLRATIVVNSIVDKTTAKGFKNILVGDRLELVTTLKHVGRASSGTYATYVSVTNLRTQEKMQKSFSELTNILRKFEVAQLI